MGLVADVFSEDVMDELRGHIALGHVRYSTTGSSLLKNAQPVLVNFPGQPNRPGAQRQPDQRVGAPARAGGSWGPSCPLTNDSEIIVSSSGAPFGDRHRTGSFGGAASRPGRVFPGTDDREGIDSGAGPQEDFGRCVWGGLATGPGLFRPKTCALDLIEAEYVRDVEPGEIVVIDENGLRSYHMPSPETKFCIFEFVYFARPDSSIFEHFVYPIRKRMGARLAEENRHLEGDLTLPFPDSGNYAGLGFGQASGIPFEFGMIRKPLCGADIHPAVAVHEGFRGAGQVETRSRN